MRTSDLGQGNLESTANPWTLPLKAGFFAVHQGRPCTRNGGLWFSLWPVSDRRRRSSAWGFRANHAPSGEGFDQPGWYGFSRRRSCRQTADQRIPSPRAQACGRKLLLGVERSEKLAITSWCGKACSNRRTSPIAAMVGLISAQRQAEMIERAMSAFDSTFNRIAADELPRAT